MLYFKSALDCSSFQPKNIDLFNGFERGVIVVQRKTVQQCSIFRLPVLQYCAPIVSWKPNSESHHFSEFRDVGLILNRVAAGLGWNGISIRFILRNSNTDRSV